MTFLSIINGKKMVMHDMRNMNWYLFLLPSGRRPLDPCVEIPHNVLVVQLGQNFNLSHDLAGWANNTIGETGKSF